QANFFYDKWTLLNTSLFNRGVFIEIPKNYKAEGTLNIQHDFVEGGLEFPFTYLKLNEGSELNLIEEYNGGINGLKHVVGNTIINQAAGSKLNHVFIQNLSRESKGLFYQNAVLDRDAEFQTHSVHLGSKTARAIQNIEFREQGGCLKNYGLLYGRNRQHFDIQITQTHKAPYTGGEVLYRHVLADRAKSIFKGKIVIEKEEAFCNATQKNENLLLSPKAEAISLPKLEILNNDVQCSHGATISSIDEDQLFYMTSRGIGMDNARKMIVEGFFEEIIKKSATKDMAEVISRKVKEMLCYELL
ncbi:MAG: Fe-S cluster assembly protein SufD, partial [Nitrospinota bacterium]